MLDDSCNAHGLGKRQSPAISWGDVSYISISDYDGAVSSFTELLPTDPAGTSVVLKLDEQVASNFVYVDQATPPLQLYSAEVPNSTEDTAFMRTQLFNNAVARLQSPWLIPCAELFLDPFQAANLHPFARLPLLISKPTASDPDAYFLYTDGTRAEIHCNIDDQAERRLAWAVTILAKCSTAVCNPNAACSDCTAFSHGDDVQHLSQQQIGFTPTCSSAAPVDHAAEYSFLGVFGAQLLKQDEPPSEFCQWHVMQAIKAFVPGQMLCTDPDIPEAEMAAVVWAMLWCISNVPHRKCTIYTDCLLVVQYIEGSASFSKSHCLATFMVNLAQLYSLLCAGLVIHIAGHSGNPWNELSDSVSKAINVGQIQSSTLPWSLIAPFAVSKADGEWLWMETMSKEWLESLPCLQDGYFRGARPHQSQDAALFTLGEAAQPGDHLSIQWSSVSANILSAGFKAKPNVPSPKEDEGSNDDVDNPTCGRHTCGRSLVLAAAWKEANVLFTFSQEARTDEAEYTISPYVLFSGGRDQWGNDGVEIGVNLDMAYGVCNGVEMKIRREQLQPCHAEPNIILCTCVADMLHILLGSAHALTKTDSHPLEERKAWWQKLSQAISRHRGSALVLIGLDANADVGSVLSQFIGEAKAEKQCSNGECKHKLLQDLHLFVPSTFDHVQEGPGVTFRHPKHHTWKRKDYLLTCGTMFNLVRKAYVPFNIDVSIKRLDHLPVALDFSGTLLRADSPKWRIKPTIGNRTFHQKSQQQGFCSDLAAQLPPPWASDASLHCQCSNRTLNDLMAKNFSLQVKLPKKDFLAESTWEQVLLKRCLQHKHAYASVQLPFVRRRQWLYRWALAVAQLHKDDNAAPRRLVTRSVWLNKAREMAMRFRRYTAQEYWFGIRAARLARCTTKLVKRDKSKALSDIASKAAAAKLQHDEAQLCRELQFLGCKAKRRPISYCKALPALLNDDGMLVSNAVQRQELMLKHFSEQSLGSIQTLAQIAERILDRHSKATAIGFDSRCTFSWTEIARLFGLAKSLTAPGDDCIPSVLLKQNRLQVAKSMLPLFLKCSMFAVEPLQWHGSRAVDIPKKGNPKLRENRKNIMVEGHIGKSFHRGVVEKLAQSFSVVQDDN